MAAVWTIEFDVADLPNKLLNVTGTRTQDLDVRTYTLSGISGDTDDRLPAVILEDTKVQLQNAHLDAIARQAKQSQIDALLGTWKTALENALNAEEA